MDNNQILNAVPHPIIVVNDENDITYANAAAELFYHSGLELLKKNKIDDLLPFGCPILSAIDQVREKSCSFNEYGINVATPKLKDNYIVDVYCGPVGDSTGSFKNTGSSARCSHILIQFQLRSMAQMIERQISYRGAAKTVNGVAAVLAHEIKNPLSGIRGAAQLLEVAVTEDDQMLARLICEETDRIRKLVDRMEIFGDERPIQTIPINIHSVLHHVTEIAKNGFASNIEIEEHYDPSLPKVAGERDFLIQLYLNLVKNAAEALEGRDDGVITLSTSFRPGFRLTLPGTKERVILPLEIVVKDNGPGVREDILPHLFDPFVTSKETGSGLGLALVAKMVADHGGTIECDSSVDGTIFRTRLPIADEAKTSNSKELAPAAEENKNEESVNDQ